jgi:myo-inositol-1(or 4)-monophosphatase
MNLELEILLQTVKEAGAAILSLQKTGFSVERKSNWSLVTKADLLANDILRNHLTSKFPDYGWLSEESKDSPERLMKERVWIVDPIDGTKEFVAGLGEYAVSVALIENGFPILGCVLNPATDELFYAIKGKGAWLGRCRLKCDESLKPPFLFLVSRTEYARGEWKQFEQTHRIQQVGSIAYKLALLAAGRAHATFSLGPKNEWDIAAGTLLVTEAGGIVTDARGEKFIFNQAKTLVNGIVATTASVNKLIFSLLSSNK